MKIRSWFAVIVVASLLTLAACGDGDDDDETTNGDTTEPEATQPADDADDTEDEGAPGFEQYSAFSGQWSGDWNNTTFGSTGTVTLTITVNDDGTADFTLDVDGQVFGAADPPAMTFSGTYDADGAHIAVTGDALFGDVTIDATADGAFTLDAINIPAPGIAGFSALGTATPDGVDMTYIVTFDDGTTAEGTGTLTKS